MMRLKTPRGWFDDAAVLNWNRGEWYAIGSYFEPGDGEPAKFFVKEIVQGRRAASKLVRDRRKTGEHSRMRRVQLVDIEGIRSNG